MLHDIGITQTSMCRRITSSSCFTILVRFTFEFFPALLPTAFVRFFVQHLSAPPILKVRSAPRPLTPKTLCAKVPAGPRSNQRADVVWRRWNATRSDHQGTYTINPNFCRNNRASRESMLHVSCVSPFFRRRLSFQI